MTPTYKTLLQTCECLLDQYVQVCQDNHVSGFPGMIADAFSIIRRAKGTVPDVEEVNRYLRRNRDAVTARRDLNGS